SESESGQDLTINTTERWASKTRLTIRNLNITICDIEIASHYWQRTYSFDVTVCDIKSALDGVTLMTLFHDFGQAITRRYFFKAGSHAVGWAALASLLNADAARGNSTSGHAPVKSHFPGKAKQVIYLHMVGGPSQMDLYDYKPVMQQWYDK